MIGDYANQTATWKSKTTVDEYNQPTFAPDVTIKCRFEYKRKMVRDKQGQTVVSEARVFTISPIRPDDIVVFDSIDWVVLSVANQADLDGSILFYEVSL